MFKKEKVKDGPARERPKAASANEETAAYEDSWYRSLKALAERRRNHDDNRDHGHAADSNGHGEGVFDPAERRSTDEGRFGNDEAHGVPED
jgi:hypothetical protein